MPKNGIFKLFLIFFLLASTALVVKYFVKKEKTKHLVQESREVLEMAQTASELVALWRSGDPTMLAPFCRDQFDPTIKYPDHYFRCNPDYMKCLLSQRPKFGEVQVSWLRVLPAQGTRDWGLALKLERGELIETLVLGDSCSSVELPQRRYSFKTGKEDIKWDSFNRHIKIDRSLVSWRDVREWTSSQNVTLAFAKPELTNVSMRHMAALGLTLDEMHSYCRYRGKTLASLPVFEAASYHPRDKSKVRPSRIVRTPYPWTIYRKSDFLYRARTKRWKPNREDCRKAYVKECEAFGGMESFGDSVPTWTGVLDTIGGFPEVFENPYEPTKNFFVSNQEMSAASTWHELGKYAHWNGVGFSSNDFEFNDDKLVIEFPLLPGFRCMEEM